LLLLGERLDGDCRSVALVFRGVVQKLFATLFGDLFEHLARFSTPFFRRSHQQNPGLIAISFHTVAAAVQIRQRHFGRDVPPFYTSPQKIYSLGQILAAIAAAQNL
jgi:hypothetical protein